MSGIAYIDRLYDDPFDAAQPWLRIRRGPDELDEREWHCYCEYLDGRSDEADFDTVDEAVAWCRERAERVTVRLGGYEDTYYSAGERPSTNWDGMPYPDWPPHGWPEYAGPTQTAG